ncbi:MAG: T9SS type A sorting domain-containing protein [Muribaculaceae bacterium]
MNKKKITIGCILLVSGLALNASIAPQPMTGEGVTVTSKEGVSDNNNKKMVKTSSKLFFTAETVANGEELWVSDGTAVGTKMVKDIVPGKDGSNPQWLCLVGNKCYFSAQTPDKGNELWVSDGTEAGTNIVKDIYIDGSSSPFGLTKFGDKLLFYAMDEESELIPVIDSAKPEKWLWVSDGTEAGTIRIGDTPTRETGYDGEVRFGVLKDKALFVGYSAETNETLWVTDGTKAGTKIVKDINPTPFVGWSATASANIDWITVVGNKAVFRAETVATVTNDKTLGVDGNIGSEIWISDGTPEGTNWIGVDFASGTLNGAPLASQFASTYAMTDNLLIFRADDAVHHVEPCIMDINKPFVKDVNPKMIYDINTWGFPADKRPSWPSWNNMVYNGMLYLQANGVYHMPDVANELYTGYSLWRIDVSSLDIAQINSAGYLRTWSNPAMTINQPNKDDKSRLFTEVAGKLYFVADDAKNNSELWCMDNNDSNPYKVHDFADNGMPHSLQNFNEVLYFIANVDKKLYKIGEPPAGVTDVVNDVKIKIYPNPASEFVNVSADQEILNISIYDVQGHLMIDQDNAHNINISSLQGGLYFIRIKTQNGDVVSQKLIVE